MIDPPGAFWPSPRQRLLLVAALGDPGSALAAWQEVRPRISIDELEGGSFEILPLVYRNLSEAEHDDVDLPRLKGIYRRAWVRNNLLVERTKTTQAALAAREIRAEFVEGVVLASRFYPDLGLRPTSAIDVLVAPEHAKRALAALSRSGWSGRGEAAPRCGEARQLFDDDGNFCVLRTALAPDLTPRPCVRAWLWPGGGRHSLGDVEISVPPPTETLFGVCVLHARRDELPNVQWILDAKMVLQTAIDWERLLVLAAQCGQVVRLRAALGYLAGLPGPTPPPEVLDRLGTSPVGKRERVSYLCSAGAIRGPGGLPALVGEHLAMTRERSTLGVVVSFPGFLRERWRLESAWHVPLAVGKRAMRLLGRRGRAL